MCIYMLAIAVSQLIPSFDHTLADCVSTTTPFFSSYVYAAIILLNNFFIGG